MTIKQRFYKFLGKTPDTMPMVRYWKTKQAVEAKVTESDDGSMIMVMEGEKYPFPGFPRGHLLFGKLSKLKHEVKNQVFNASWHLLEKGSTGKEIASRIEQDILPRIFALFSEHTFDILPPRSMSPSVREIHRAWTKSVPGPVSYKLRDMICHVLQEDDGYRFRLQWVIGYFNPNTIPWRFMDPVKLFGKALAMLEYGEIIGDMKERVRLLRRVLLAILEDPRWHSAFTAFVRECDWKKVRLSEGDKYHFRGKWFRVDLDKFDY